MSKAVLLTVNLCQNIPDPDVIGGLTKIGFTLCVATIGESPQEIASSIFVNPADSSAVIRQKFIDVIKADVLNQLSITLANEDIIIPSYTTGLATLASETRTDNFSVAGNGVTVDTSLRPLSVFSLGVDGVGGTPTAWQVVLEGSLDGTKWSTILTHTQLSPGLGLTISSGSNRDPSLFMRSRCVSVILGSASAIKTTILGVP